MANQKRQTVSYRKFKVQNLLPEGLLGVSRSRGEVARSISSNFASLAKQAGGLADIAAKNEGTRAGRIEGAQEDFRPTRSNSIRGQAYDRAGEHAYMSKLETDLRSDMQGLYDEHKDSPVQLKASLESLKKEYDGKHVYAEIAGDFNLGFEKLSTGYQKSASDAFEKRQNELAYAERLGRLNDLETTSAQALANLDPSSEAGGAIINDSISQYEREINDAVASDQMSPAQGELAKQSQRRKFTESFYTSQADKLKTPQELDSFQAQLEQDFASGKLTNVDADAFYQITKKIDAQKKRALTQDNKNTKVLDKRADQLAARIAAGFEPEPGEVTTLIQDVKNSSQSEELLRHSTLKIELAQKFQSSTIGESKALADELVKDARKSGNEEDLQLAIWAQQTSESIRSEVVDNPLEAAINRGVLERSPEIIVLEGMSSDEYATAISERVIEAKAAAEHWGVPPVILNKSELRNISIQVDENPALGIDLAAGLLAGSGDQRGRVLQELGKSAPKIAQAGKVMLAGGTREAAVDAIRGSSKTLDGKARPKLPSELQKTTANQVLGGVFAVQKTDGDLTVSAATNIARARIADAGIDPKSDDEVRPIYENALQDAVGRNYHDGQQYGGIGEINDGWFVDSKVIVPPTMRADLFVDVIQSLTDEDIAATGSLPQSASGEVYPAKNFHSATPVAVAGGYAFAMGDISGSSPQWIRGEDGNPYVLNIEGMRDQLAGRVPGAWK